MREIKFRAWNIHLEKMQKKVMGVFEDSIYFVEKDNMGIYSWTEAYAGDYQIMQYTGLKDKNGKEIYEGDILIQPSDIYKINVVKWNSFRWEGIWRHGKAEVSGNIYENPELLESK